jgi:hypothetical protein
MNKQKSENTTEWENKFYRRFHNGIFYQEYPCFPDCEQEEISNEIIKFIKEEIIDQSDKIKNTPKTE